MSDCAFRQGAPSGAHARRLQAGAAQASKRALLAGWERHQRPPSVKSDPLYVRRAINALPLPYSACIVRHRSSQLTSGRGGRSETSAKCGEGNPYPACCQPELSGCSQRDNSSGCLRCLVVVHSNAKTHMHVARGKNAAAQRHDKETGAGGVCFHPHSCFGVQIGGGNGRQCLVWGYIGGITFFERRLWQEKGQGLPDK